MAENIFRFFAVPIAAALIGLLPGAGFAGKLADTGQAACYDNSAAISCPEPGKPFYGQDGSYPGIPMSLVDNKNGTVTDTVSGLIWQQRDDGMLRNWAEAMDYCANLSLTGHADWRLPSKKEIMTIVDYGRTDPAMDPDIFPDTKRGWYWTATARAVDPTYAWGLFAANGRIHGSHKLGGSYAGHGRVYGGLKANDYYARCVRGGR